MSNAELLVTGKYFAGQGLRGVMPAMQELVLAARSELHVAAYVLTEGAAPLIDLVERAVASGVRLTWVANQMNGSGRQIQKRLETLQQQYDHARVRYFADPDGSQLHAKVLVADRRRAVLGSANYSWGGLVANHEVGVLLDGDLAWRLAGLIDGLASSAAS